jgi:hypothetical protein
MSQFRSAPQFGQGIAEGVKNNAVWYRYFQASEAGQPPDNESVIPLSGSPLLFTAPRKGYLIASGGTITAVAISRTAPIFYGTGQTSGSFYLAQGDVLKVTYSGKPALVFFPT